jgi:hypothetical protein
MLCPISKNDLQYNFSFIPTCDAECTLTSPHPRPFMYFMGVELNLLDEQSVFGVKLRRTHRPSATEDILRAGGWMKRIPVEEKPKNRGR